MQHGLAALATAQADVRTRQAEVQRGRSQLQVSQVAWSRERAIFRGNLANRREIGTAQANLQSAQAKVFGTNRVLDVANANWAREQRLFHANLNDISPLQTARAAVVQAQADLQAARSTLSWLQAAPGQAGSGVNIPIRADCGRGANARCRTRRTDRSRCAVDDNRQFGFGCRGSRAV